jgi:hypothetical protein
MKLSIKLLAHHAITGEGHESRDLRRKGVAVLDVRRASAIRAQGQCHFQPKPTPPSDLYCEWLTREQALAIVRHLL